MLGGSRQTVYYPLMRSVLYKALDTDQISDKQFRNALCRDIRPGVWGHRVLLPTSVNPFDQLEAATESGELASLIDDYGNLTLEEACGDMPSFIQDPIWKALAASIAAGKTSADSPDWRSAQSD